MHPPRHHVAVQDLSLPAEFTGDPHPLPLPHHHHPHPPPRQGPRHPDPHPALAATSPSHPAQRPRSSSKRPHTAATPNGSPAAPAPATAAAAATPPPPGPVRSTSDPRLLTLPDVVEGTGLDPKPHRSPALGSPSAVARAAAAGGVSPLALPIDEDQVYGAAGASPNHAWLLPSPTASARGSTIPAKSSPTTIRRSKTTDSPTALRIHGRSSITLDEISLPVSLPNSATSSPRNPPSGGRKGSRARRLPRNNSHETNGPPEFLAGTSPPRSLGPGPAPGHRRSRSGGHVGVGVGVGVGHGVAAEDIGGARLPARGVEGILEDIADDTLSDDEFVDMLDTLAPDVRRTVLKSLSGNYRRLSGLLEVFKGISASLDLNEAIVRIVSKVSDFLKADRASLFVIDHKRNELWSRVAKDSPEIRIPMGKGIAGHVAAEGTVINIADAPSDARFNPENDLKSGYRTKTILACPIYDSAGERVAVLQAINKRDDEPFSAEDEADMQLLAVQAGQCLRNSQLYTSALRSQRNIGILLDVAKQLSSELDLTQLCRVIMHKAGHLLDADRCTLFLVDRDRKELWSKVAESSSEIRFPMTMGIAGHVAQTGETVNIPDAYKDSRFNADIDRKTGYRTRSILCMPLCNAKGNVIGVTQMINKRNGQVFAKEDETLLNAFSSQASVAIENSKLFETTIEMGNFLQSVLHSINNLVLTFDMNGLLMTSNHPTLTHLGLPEEHLRETPFTEWLAPRNLGLKFDMSLVYSQGIKINREGSDLRVERPEEAPLVKHVNYSVAPLKDFRQVQTGVVVIVEDITSQQQLQNTLSRYMSPALAEEVIKGGNLKLGGQHQKVTTVFCDIRKFTTLSESMDAVAVVEMLNEYFSHMVDAVFEEQGVLDKFMGDAVMAVFGVPLEREDDSRRACMAAIKMLQRLGTFNKARVERGEDPVRIGIGVSTGRVLSGNIGSQARMEYTVIGAPVNAASRVESCTKEYGVTTLVTEDTFQEVSEWFVTREIDRIKVAGMTKPFTVYELVCPKEDRVEDDLLKVHELYARGLEYYRARRFALAAGAFRAANDINHDSASAVFVRRCEAFAQNRPGDDWEGVWMFDHK